MDTANIDNMLKVASDSLEALVNQVEALQNENTQLRTELEAVKAASAEKITLEKVASDKVATLVSELVSHSILPDTEREKTAAAQAMMENPNNIIDICLQAVKSSELPQETGRGVKSASVEANSKSADELWKNYFDSNEATY